MNISRLAAFLFSAAGFAGMVVSGLSLAKRVEQYNIQAAHPLFAFAPFDSTNFTFRDRPVTIEDRTDNGIRRLVIDYDGQKLAVNATLPSQYKLPGLKSHEDWFRIFRMLDSTGKDFDELTRQLNAGEIKSRLIIVTRTPLPGASEGWAETWRKDWVFDFYEFLDEGGFTHEQLSYPRTRAGKLPGPGELQPNTWQYEAALRLMPRSAPTLTFRENAVSNPGWQLRVFAASSVVWIFGLAFGFAPARRRPQPVVAESGKD